jgi:hypothetical protein
MSVLPIAFLIMENLSNPACCPKRGFAFLLVAALAFTISSCSPEVDDPGANGGGGTNQATLVTNLNGYRYEGTFKETVEPSLYLDPVIWHIEEYMDSIRLIFSTEYEINVQTTYHRWTVQSLHKGKVNRQYEASNGALNPIDYKFAFNQEAFQLYGYSVPQSYVTLFAKGKSPAGFYLSKPNNNFTFLFNENYTVFFGSASSIYSFENKYQKYTAPAPTQGYVLTSEPSVAWADYVINDDALSATLFREEIITCFFNATLDNNYIGIAKGQQTLDTLVVNKNPPNWYYPVTYVNASKLGNIVYLGLRKKKGLSMPDDISVYKMDLTEKIIRPVYKNIDAPALNEQAFVAGRFYYFGKMLNDSGQLVDIPLPTFASGVSLIRYHYGATRLFIVLQKDLNQIELYSKPY